MMSFSQKRSNEINILSWLFIEKLRKHPFNLKGGAMVFWGKHFLSANLIEKQNLFVKWAEKNILLELCAFKNIVLVEKK